MQAKQEGGNHVDTRIKPIAGIDYGSERPILALAKLCDSSFADSLEKLIQNNEKQYAESLQRLQLRFKDWVEYLDVFDSLDFRLRRNQQQRDLVLLILKMLNSRPLHTLSSLADANSTPEDASPGDMMCLRNVELSSIGISLAELDRAAIYIRLPPASALDTRVSVFGGRRQEEVAAFETRATITVNILYPKAPRTLRNQLVKSLTHQCLRLLYWKFYVKKPRTDHSYHRQSIKTPSTLKDEPPNKPKHVNQNTSAKRLSQLVLELRPPLVSSRLLEQRPVTTTDTVQIESGYSIPFGTRKDESRDIPCPLCRKLFSSDEFASDGWWINHVNGDLFPFVCISSTCLEDPVYSSQSKWAAHIHEDHGSFWSPRFDTATSSGSQYGQPRAGVVPGSSKSPEPCPLCHFQPVVIYSRASPETKPGKEFSGAVGNDVQAHAGAMLDHISEHLQLLALLAPRLLVENTDYEDIRSFSATQTVSSKEVATKKPTVVNEIITLQEVKFATTDRDRLGLVNMGHFEELPSISAHDDHSSQHEEDEFQMEVVPLHVFESQHRVDMLLLDTTSDADPFYTPLSPVVSSCDGEEVEMMPSNDSDNGLATPPDLSSSETILRQDQLRTYKEARESKDLDKIGTLINKSDEKRGRAVILRTGTIQPDLAIGARQTSMPWMFFPLEIDRRTDREVEVSQHDKTASITSSLVPVHA